MGSMLGSLPERSSLACSTWSADLSGVASRMVAVAYVRGRVEVRRDAGIWREMGARCARRRALKAEVIVYGV